MDIFTWKPVTGNDIEQTSTALNTRVEFGNGNEQVQRNSVNTKKTWSITFGGTSDQLVAMQSFWDAHSNGSAFYWTPPAPFNTQGTFRFANDTFDPKDKYGIGEDGTGFCIVGFTVKLALRKVYP